MFLLSGNICVSIKVQYSEYFYELLVIMSSHLVLVHTIAPYATILINIKAKV